MRDTWLLEMPSQPSAFTRSSRASSTHPPRTPAVSPPAAPSRFDAAAQEDSGSSFPSLSFGMRSSIVPTLVSHARERYPLR